MADNSVRTPGSGETIHSDEYTHATLGSGKTQLIKLVDGTLDSSTAIASGGGTETNALRTTPAVLATATLTTLASSASSAQLLASTTGRRGLILYNSDANGVYVKYGTTASSTSFTVLIPASGYWEMPVPIYTGRIDAIWIADGSGSLFSTELT